MDIYLIEVGRRLGADGVTLGWQVWIVEVEERAATLRPKHLQSRQQIVRTACVLQIRSDTRYITLDIFISVDA